MTRFTLGDALAQFAEAGKDPVPAFTQLIAALRPEQSDDGESATRNLLALCHFLSMRPDYRENLRHALIYLVTNRKATSLYVDAGVFPNTGFFTESARRLTDTMLPNVPDQQYLKDIVAIMFTQSSDAQWLGMIEMPIWQAVLEALRFDEISTDHKTIPPALAQVLEALRVMSYRISAIGLEPELVRIEPTIEEFESPFLAQNVEMVAYLANYRQNDNAHDTRHVLVLLDQCRGIVDKIRNRAGREGTSLSLTFHLGRLEQLLARSEILLSLAEKLREQNKIEPAYPEIIALWVNVVRAECRRNNLRHYWRKNIELLARRVTDNASRTGEHYITETRSEYFVLLRSAMLGGIIIAMMALLKLAIAKMGLPPLSEALLFCLNYGVGFMLIHILHGTVATKQPAMTANTIAATLSEGKGRARELSKTAGVIARLTRSQIAAIAGNVGLAIPMAMLIAWGYHKISGNHILSAEKAVSLLNDAHPWLSGSIFYAAIAGICLFLAGLIAGYYDNSAAYNRIPERILLLRWPRKVFGESRMWRVSEYIRDNLGALAGNLAFGFMLGGVTAFGMLFGLPLDIRHIAFSSAYLGYASMLLDWHAFKYLFVWAGVGVLLIGLVNLSVSFALALFVALRARGVDTTQQRQLFTSVLQKLRHHTREFFLPPPRQSNAIALENASTDSKKALPAQVLDPDTKQLKSDLTQKARFRARKAPLPWSQIPPLPRKKA